VLENKVLYLIMHILTSVEIQKPKKTTLLPYHHIIKVILSILNQTHIGKIFSHRLFPND